MDNFDTTTLVGLITAISTGISAIMLAFGKHVMPVIMSWIGVKDQETKNAEQILKLENNHLVHIQEDIDKMGQDLKEIKDEQVKQGNRLTRVETKLEITT